MEMDEYLKILILRTLGLSQDEVAEHLHCAKQTVGDAEKWFTSCSSGEADALVDDQRIRRLVDRELLAMELTDNQLNKVDEIVGDDILLHYGMVHPQKQAEEAESADEEKPVLPALEKVHPMYVKVLERHWERLREQAMTLRRQLSLPTVDDLFTAEVCQRAYRAKRSRTSLLWTHSWRHILDAPFEARLSGTATTRIVEIRLAVEEEDLFPYLLYHLQTEFAEFSQFEACKGQFGRLMQMCLKMAEEVTESCGRAARMDYLSKGRRTWLSFHFPAYVCQFVFNHFHSRAMPKLRREGQPDGLWRLMPDESPAVTLALDTADHIHHCQEVLVNEVEKNAKLPVWRKIRKENTALKQRRDALQAMLTTAIERGSFEGTCPLCEGFFVSPPNL